MKIAKDGKLVFENKRGQISQILEDLEKVFPGFLAWLHRQKKKQTKYKPAGGF